MSEESLPQNATYHEMPQEMFPVHLFNPSFQTLGMWFPALDAWVLEMLCRRQRTSLANCRLDILEIGTFVGGSAVILAPHACRLVCADTWNGSGKPGDEMEPFYESDNPYQTFQENIKLLDIRPVVHVRKTEPDSLPDFLKGAMFDLIFIDGAHDYDSVVADIAIARKHISPSGIICGHDFTLFKGVTKAVLDFGDEVGNVNACGTIWWKEMP